MQIKCPKCKAVYPDLVHGKSAVDYDEGLVVYKFGCTSGHNFERTFVMKNGNG